MYQITSYFGSRESFRNKGHSGIDFAMPNGTELKSIRDGVVEQIYDLGNRNIGKGVKIRFNNGESAIYGHMSDTSPVTQGQTVHAGELIGLSGNSGHVKGSNGGYHLHFGLKGEDGKFLDPSPYINDIQHMNDANYFVEAAPSIPHANITFTDFMNQHMSALNDMFSQLKLNFIGLIFNDSLFSQISQHSFQFLAAHSGFLNDMIRSIF